MKEAFTRALLCFDSIAVYIEMCGYTDLLVMSRSSLFPAMVFCFILSILEFSASDTNRLSGTRSCLETGERVYHSQ